MANTYIELVVNSYRNCFCLEEGSDATTTILSPDDEDVLLSIYQDTGGSVLLGLEKSIIRSMAQDVIDRRHELVHIVGNLQKEGSSAEIDEDIRRSCETISKPSTLYARHKAQLMSKIK
eukprot:CAMPEP_0198147824 /NCGR_PEP_ID=MMETSP1443-20131203/37969_1 /TAXON_ID=186043 /ORGANISM="Entomoneis sp., Strain CCMP2396" /LENGTH=118 /DNA_ID=CAMNT_0043812315 /DNA_START=81 /DNA_END=437 /DNA_ORIENTATION=+